MAETLNLTIGLHRDGQEFLTDPSTPQYAGMAHFAGTGPRSKTCRECAFWMHRNRWTREAALGSGGEPHPARCRRHRQFTMKHRGPTIPHNAHACKWFEQSDRPQPIKRPKKTFEE